MITWYKVETYPPPDKQLLLVTGDSGYVNHKRFMTLAYIDESYRPSKGGPPRWLNVQNDELIDQGWEPTHWAYNTINYPDE
jgi:hypothetical protein